MRRRLPVKSTTIVPWYECDGGARLRQDLLAIADSYPDLHVQIDKEQHRCRLLGQVVLVAACGIPTPIDVEVIFPHSYPQHEPWVYETGGRFERIPDRHFSPGGNCCLWLDVESRWNPTASDGLRAFLDEVMVFFDRQLVYDALPISERKWPGPERSHGVLGYWEYAAELAGGNEALLKDSFLMIGVGLGKIRNHLCPCGSGKKVKHCHLQLMETLSRSVPSKPLRVLVQHIRSKNKVTAI